MGLNLRDLLSLHILDSYKVIAGKAFLQKEVEQISLLETPDFEKYVRDKALILTTLYPIKSDLTLFKKLIYVLRQHQAAGLIVKLKRYIEAIPTAIIELCDVNQIPLITLDYDANLSDISTRVINELTSKSLQTISLSSFYIELVKTLDEQPKLETILGFKERFENMDYWVYSQPQQRAVSTNKELDEVAEKLAEQPLTFLKLDDYFAYVDEVKLSNQLIYQVVFFLKEDSRSKIYYFAEIIKMMLVFIYQKRQENSLQQNQFLLETITGTSNGPTTNESLIDRAEIYGWKIKFPLHLILCQVHHTTNKKIDLSEDLRDDFIREFDLKKDAIRYVHFNQRILYILNDSGHDQVEATLKRLIREKEKNYPLIEIKIAYTSNLRHVEDLASAQATLNRGLNFINQRTIREKVFNDQSVKMITMLGKVSEPELKEFVDVVLSSLIQYEQKHGGQLIETLYALISHQFHLKKTAAALFIHYNTLRHRLQILDSLGYGPNKLATTHYDLIFAVYLAKNLGLYDK